MINLLSLSAMDNEAGGDDEGDYSSYNIVSKKRSIEQNSDGSNSNNKNHVGENRYQS